MSSSYGDVLMIRGSIRLVCLRLGTSSSTALRSLAHRVLRSGLFQGTTIGIKLVLL
jgi:hypothetical protein